ncbi:cellulose biosynthesis protein BcsQ [Pseudomonas sp. Marseille-P9899]|uniref:cellulose biosynthesis protein BcsQ n=1 Tax=Pseudomonas sp. Marseille-P9899 TaxID=2730401 RepID=UPI0015889FF5|nr:cellulose biosynthesis protein BcsQ [Pseudomonas sp. Marseille-P9899]
MSQADDIGNLFHRFGASADSYKEINTEFEFLEPLPVAAVSVPTAPTPAKPVAMSLVETRRMPVAPPLPEPVLTVPPADSSGVIPPGTSLRERLALVARDRRAAAEENNRHALDDALRAQPPQRPKAHVIVVMSAKGGAGKTTVAASLSKLLKRTTGRTLVLDLDPQNSLLSHFGLPRSTPGINQARLQDAGWDGIRTLTENGIECLPFGPSNAADVRAFEAQLAANPAWLMQQLATLELGAEDLLVIDTATGATPWLHQVLGVANQVIALTLADAASYLVLDKLQAWLAPLRPGTCGFLVNQVDAQSPLSLDMTEVLRQQLGDRWLAALPLDHQLDEALAYEYDPLQQPLDSPACQVLRAVAHDLAQRIEQYREETSAS